MDGGNMNASALQKRIVQFAMDTFSQRQQNKTMPFELAIHVDEFGSELEIHPTTVEKKRWNEKHPARSRAKPPGLGPFYYKKDMSTT